MRFSLGKQDVNLGSRKNNEIIVIMLAVYLWTEM